MQKLKKALVDKKGNNFLESLAECLGEVSANANAGNEVKIEIDNFIANTKRKDLEQAEKELKDAEK